MNHILVKTLGVGILAVVTAVGLYELALLFINGHQVLNATQFIPWGLWVSLYIFFLGLSAGSFLLSTLIYVFGVKKLEPVGPLSLFQALVCLLLGGFFIMIDLGHPFRSYNLFLSMNPTSAMAWMGIFYLVYILVILWELYIVLKPIYAHYAEKGKIYSFVHALMGIRAGYLHSRSEAKDARTLKILGILGIPVAVLVHGGVGTIFALAKGRPLWNSGMFPIIFLVSALVSGGALLTLLTGIISKLPRERKLVLMQDLAKLTVGILALDLLLLAAEVLVALYSGIPHETHAWTTILFGGSWWIFWFVQMGLGVVVPLFILFGKRTRASMGWLGFLGLSVVMGILGTRYNIVVPAQIAEPLKGMTEAYNHFRFTVEYVPSPNEILIALFGLALTVWSIWIGVKLLPLDQGVEEL